MRVRSALAAALLAASALVPARAAPWFVLHPSPFRGALDVYSPGQVLGAWSSRRLTARYTGPLWQVRRSSDNTTAQIYPIQPSGDLSISSLFSFCGSATCYLVTEYDQSGLHNDAIQSTASAQPVVWASGGLAWQGGRPSVTYNGSSDYLTSALSSALLGTSFEIACACQVTTGQANAAAVFWRSGGSSATGIDEQSAGRWGYTEANVPQTFSWAGGPTFTTGISSIVSMIVSPASASMFLSGSAAYTNTTSATAPSAASLAIGQDTYGGRFFNGLIGEVVVLSSPTLAQHRAYELNVRAYWRTQ